MSRSEAKSIAEKLGAKVLGSVSKKLDILVVGDSKPTKKKVDIAKVLKVKIISEKEWNKILDNWASFFKFYSLLSVHKVF